MDRRQHALGPSLVTGGTRALGKSCSWTVRVARARRNIQGFVPFLLPPLPFPWTHPSALHHHSVAGAYLAGSDPMKEAGGKLTIRRHGAQGPFSFQPGGSTSFGCSRCSFTAGGPAWIWRLWPVQREQAHQVHGAGLIGWHILPAPSAPRQSTHGT